MNCMSFTNGHETTWKVNDMSSKSFDITKKQPFCATSLPCQIITAAKQVLSRTQSDAYVQSGIFDTYICQIHIASPSETSMSYIVSQVSAHTNCSTFLFSRIQISISISDLIWSPQNRLKIRTPFHKTLIDQCPTSHQVTEFPFPKSMPELYLFSKLNEILNRFLGFFMLNFALFFLLSIIYNRYKRSKSA